MAKIDKKQIEHLAKLANLILTSRQVDLYENQLSKILKYIEKINVSINPKIEKPSNVIGQKNVFREDKITPSLTQDQALSNAKTTHQGFFLVTGNQKNE